MNALDCSIAVHFVSKEGLGLAKVLQPKALLQMVVNLQGVITACRRHQEVVNVEDDVQVQLAVVE